MLTWIVRVVCDLIFKVLEGQEAVIWRPNLPTEILSNILLRLPTASLQRLKCVSKEWLEIISDPHFIELHLACQPLEFELIHSLLIIEESYRYRYRVSSFFLESPGLRHSQKRKTPTKAKVLCSSKGLVLFEKENGLYVANPVTGDRLRLPPVPGYCCPITHGNIVCDSSSKEYKVVIIHRLKCYILTLQRQGCSAWRKVDLPRCHSVSVSYNPIFSRGCLHWITVRGITSMELDQENLLQETKYPFGSICIANYRRVSIVDKNTHISILDDGPIFLEWGGGLAVVPTYRWKPSYCIFILMESRWSELEIDVTFFEHMSPCDNFGVTPPYPVASLRNGEVIIFKKLAENTVDHDNCFFACHLQRREITPFKAVAPQGKVYIRVRATIGMDPSYHIWTLYSHSHPIGEPAIIFSVADCEGFLILK